MQKQDITIHIGTTPPPVVVTVTDSSSEVFNLTGCSVSASIKDSQGNQILDLLPVITDAELGIITVAPTDEETATLSPNNSLGWDLILELSDGRVLPPLVYGGCKIKKTITL